MARPSVEVQRLCCDYGEALAQQGLAQARLLEARRGSGCELAGYLHIGEHSPVYTLGKHAREGNVLVSPTQLGAPVVRIDRGGDVTYHGPGQLVMYPIFDLRRLGLGPRAFVEALLRAVGDAVSEWGLAVQQRADGAGLWLPPADGAPLRKVCAVGVRISQGVTSHGVALNVNTELEAFAKINPCGFTDRGVTSMARELGHPVPVGRVGRRVLAHVAECFGVCLQLPANLFA